MNTASGRVIFAAGQRNGGAQHDPSQSARRILEELGSPVGPAGASDQSASSARTSFANVAAPERGAVVSRNDIRSRVQPKAGGAAFFKGDTMSPSRQILYLVTVCAAVTLIVKSAQIAFTPELRTAAEILLAGILGNVVVQALLITVGLVWLVSICAWTWERADRDYVRRAEEAARRYPYPSSDTSSLMDDSPQIGPRDAA